MLFLFNFHAEQTLPQKQKYQYSLIQIEPTGVPR